MLLQEHKNNNQCRITESNGNKYIEGLVFACDVPNLNKRVYPLSEVKREVDRLQAEMRKGRKIKTILDHTEKGEKLSQHLGFITDFAWKENKLFARSKLQNTLAANTLLEIAESGCKYGFSPESKGDLIDKGDYKQVSNLKIQLVAVVPNPSNASQAKIISESISRLIREVTFNDKLEGILSEMIADNVVLTNKQIDPFVANVVEYLTGKKQTDRMEEKEEDPYDAILREFRK